MLPELHQHEQYFFTRETSRALAAALATFTHPCLLCAPTVGLELAHIAHPCRVLDIDARFSSVPGFNHWNLYRPQFLDESFGAIFCDPPFFNASLSQLFTAIRTLTRFRFDHPLAITYLTRRATAITSTFAPFNVQPTGYFPTYQTVDTSGRTAIEVFANFPSPLWPSA